MPGFFCPDEQRAEGFQAVVGTARTVGAFIADLADVAILHSCELHGPAFSS
jgi:hypothetical protein